MTSEPLQTIDRAGFTEVWHSDQPDTYVVVRDEWQNDYTERHIYEVEER